MRTASIYKRPTQTLLIQAIAERSTQVRVLSRRVLSGNTGLALIIGLVLLVIGIPPRWVPG